MSRRPEKGLHSAAASAMAAMLLRRDVGQDRFVAGADDEVWDRARI